jgi:drug/metabolite transporter (DMT)-like permease
LTAWYSILSSALLLGTISVMTQTWNAPHTALGWVAFLAIGVTTTGGILAMFISTRRIGPFRTALLNNLEPLVAAALSVLLLGEVITPVQAVGGIASCWRLWPFSSCAGNEHERWGR